MTDAPFTYRHFLRSLGSSPVQRVHTRDSGRGHAGYRAEIDGVRALAVLAVVFYHFSIPGFEGGFVGVDIFFVISGFLIGGILWREMTQTGTLALGAFYTRRIRRLAPAFVVVMATTMAVGYVVLLPFEFRDLGKSLVSSVLYLSNVNFFRAAGYFDGAADQKILLHTWSLSLEEQFYLLIPVLMFLMRRHLLALKWALVAIFAASLVACILVTPISSTAAFYLFPFRAWQMLAGVLLAIALYQREAQGLHTKGPNTWGLGTARALPAVSWLGLAMLVASIVLLRPGPAIPGALALIPTVGTLLVLANGTRDNAVNRCLSAPVCVFLGAISYPLYLWHWPVLTLARYANGGRAETVTETIVYFAASLLLATATYLWIERPFRRWGAPSGGRMLTGAAFASVVLLVAGGTAYRLDGMPGRFDASARIHIDASADFIQDWSRCNVPADGPLKGVSVCPIGPDGPPTFLVWGDSHARALSQGLSLLADERGKSGLLIWRAGCPPLFGIEKVESATTRQQDRDCTDANIRIRQAMSQMKGMTSLLLIGRWSYYTEGGGTGIDAQNTITLKPGETAAATGSPDQRQLFSDALDATVDESRKWFRQVLVLRQIPEIARYDSRDVARRMVLGGADAAAQAEARMTISRTEVAERVSVSERPFEALAREGKIVWLDPVDRFCSVAICSALHDGRSFYFDNNHITNEAARSIRHLFDPLLEETVASVARGKGQ